MRMGINGFAWDSRGNVNKMFIKVGMKGDDNSKRYRRMLPFFHSDKSSSNSPNLMQCMKCGLRTDIIFQKQHL